MSDWLEIHERVFPNDGPGRPKAEALYNLAREATGPIVEVGASRGNGTVALALGSRDGHQVPVYAIDPFERVTGWAGEHYGPWLRGEWLSNILAAGCLDLVQLVMLPVGDLAECWPYPAALTFWDLGRRILDPVDRWLVDWCDYAVQMDGIVAINETGGHDLSVDRWLADHGHLLRLQRVEYYIRICHHG